MKHKGLAFDLQQLFLLRTTLQMKIHFLPTECHYVSQLRSMHTNLNTAPRSSVFCLYKQLLCVHAH